ncbi:MAG: hypothetical protein E7290_13430 [Lachnospiraceae bacterium]|nr:hypothetical protein [Lachnospiraceae bacterium]
MKFAIKCPYCGNSYIAEEGTLTCKGCGAQNGLEHVIRVVEDAEDVKQRTANRREEQMHQQRIKESNARIENQRFDTRAKYLIPIIIVVFVVVSFVGCGIIGALSTAVTEVHMQSTAKQKQIEEEKKWNEEEEVKRVLPTLETLMESLQNEDFETMLTCMYLPEGSYTLENSLEKNIRNSKLSALLGQTNEISKVVYTGYSGYYDLDCYDVTVADNTYEFLFRISNGKWGLIIEDAFFYNYEIRVPANCTVYLNDAALSSDAIVEHETRDGIEYADYKVPVLAKGEYVVKVDTVSGTYTTKFIPTDEYGYDGILEYAMFDVWHKEGIAVLEDIWMAVMTNYTESGDISELRQYFTDDISDEEIEKFRDEIKGFVNNEVYGELKNCKLKNMEIEKCLFFADDEIACIFKGDAVGVTDKNYSPSIGFRTLLYMRYEQEHWKLSKVEEGTFFGCKYGGSYIP